VLASCRNLDASRNECLCGRLRERSGSALEHLHDVTRELADGANHTEQPGVSRSPAQGPRIVIIHLANQQSLTPGINASGRRPRFPDDRWSELQILNVPHLHAQRVELRGEWRDAVEDEAEQHEPEVAVDGLRSRLIRARRLHDCRFEGVSALMIAVERYVRRESRRV
jgi:hypothetical protein